MRRPNDITPLSMIVRRVFGCMVKIPATLFNSNYPVAIDCPEVDGGKIVYSRRGTGKAAIIVGAVGSHETVVYGAGN